MPHLLEPLESRVLLATLLKGFSETILAAGLSAPTSMAFAPDGRLFVCEQTGALRVIKNGTLLSTPFVSLNVDASGERGLLGVTFDPNFASNRFVYVYHTVPGAAAHNRVSRFTANGDVAAANSAAVIVDLDSLSSATNHNGGAIHFGPDGKLYIATGENARRDNAQSLGNRLGKILRYNANGSIPTDNPFFNQSTGQNRAIWAIGLRNPFNFAFRSDGLMHINDVGQATWEEINYGAAGSNYGWPQTEGPTRRKGIRKPIFAYTHGSGTDVGDAIVGADFYDVPGRTFPKNYIGDYFYADLTSGWIRRLDNTTHTSGLFARNIAVPVAVAVGTDGALYYAARGFGDSTGIVGRIQYTPTAAQRGTASVAQLTLPPFQTAAVISGRSDMEELLSSEDQIRI